MRRPWVIVSAFVLCTTIAAACAPARVETTAAPLAGRDWRLVELGGMPAVGGNDSGRTVRIRFDADSGRVHGSGGCNRLFGPYKLSGDSLRLGPLASTKMACLDDQSNRQETAFLAALDDTRSYRISGDTLSLVGSSGLLALLVAGPGG